MFYKIRNYLNPKLPQRSISEIKSICQILFIDDQKFDVVDILKNSGWNNTKQVYDVESLDDLDIINSHILFVDIQGVGKKLKFQNEGLGLIKALKKKYTTKRVIIYSAEKQGDRFHEGLSMADARLYKNADPFEFQSLVEKFAKESFSLNECVRRIKKAYEIETGNNISENEIRKNLKSIMRRGSINNGFVANVFNLQSAANIASIISLFLKPE